MGSLKNESVNSINHYQRNFPLDLGSEYVQAPAGRVCPRLELAQSEVAKGGWGGGACGRRFYAAVPRHSLCEH